MVATPSGKIDPHSKGGRKLPIERVLGREGRCVLTSSETLSRGGSPAGGSSVPSPRGRRWVCPAQLRTMPVSTYFYLTLGMAVMGELGTQIPESLRVQLHVSSCI